MKHKMSHTRSHGKMQAARGTERKKEGGVVRDRRSALRPDVDSLIGDAQSIEEAALLRSPKQENL